LNKRAKTDQKEQKQIKKGHTNAAQMDHTSAAHATRRLAARHQHQQACGTRHKHLLNQINHVALATLCLSPTLDKINSL
jgi:hypothetical protein